MGDTLPPSGRELDVLKVLWLLGEGGVRAVFERLHPAEGLAFNTVQTLLRNMEDKGLVEHRAEGRVFVYRPTHTREQVASRFLNKVFDGALGQLVQTMLRASDADAGELRELEKMITAARRERQKREQGGHP